MAYKKAHFRLEVNLTWHTQTRDMKSNNQQMQKYSGSSEIIWSHPRIN